MPIVKDCIYNFIDISQCCIKFVDTPEFQRLRYIKQLGFVHLVYPSAVHSRLEHSLGVMHLAGKMIDILRENGADITDREKELVQIAGLFHDTGHVASSHLLDYILQENGLETHHELRSIEMLKCANIRLDYPLTGQECADVANMIQGITKTQKKPFLYEIIHNTSCGLDVDRFDYLQRDAYHTGIPGFQNQYLINCARIKNNRLSFLSKSKEEIELLYQTRRRMFRLVYRHKTVMRVERVIRNIIIKMELVEKWKTINWKDFDDCELLYNLKLYPEFKDIMTRTWDKSPVDDSFKHCTTLTIEEIKTQLENVVFI